MGVERCDRRKDERAFAGDAEICGLRMSKKDDPRALERLRSAWVSQMLGHERSYVLDESDRGWIRSIRQVRELIEIWPPHTICFRPISCGVEMTAAGDHIHRGELKPANPENLMGRADRDRRVLDAKNGADNGTRS